MADYTIITYHPETKEWGWIGTQSDVPDSDFVNFHDAPTHYKGLTYLDVVVQLPPTFFGGARFKAKKLVRRVPPTMYFLKNERGQIVDDDYDGPVEPKSAK